MSSAFETEVVVKTSLSFLRGKLFDADSVYVHGIGVFFLGILLGVVVPVVLASDPHLGLYNITWLPLIF